MSYFRLLLSVPCLLDKYLKENRLILSEIKKGDKPMSNRKMLLLYAGPHYNDSELSASDCQELVNNSGATEFVILTAHRATCVNSLFR